MPILQIQNDIPAPVKRNWKAELDVMNIGQSAEIELKFLNTVKAAISQHFHSNTDKQFTTSKTSKTHFRVWRLEDKTNDDAA